MSYIYIYIYHVWSHSNGQKNAYLHKSRYVSCTKEWCWKVQSLENIFTRNKMEHKTRNWDFSTSCTGASHKKGYEKYRQQLATSRCIGPQTWNRAHNKSINFLCQQAYSCNLTFQADMVDLLFCVSLLIIVIYFVCASLLLQAQIISALHHKSCFLQMYYLL